MPDLRNENPYLQTFYLAQQLCKPRLPCKFGNWNFLIKPMHQNNVHLIKTYNSNTSGRARAQTEIKNISWLESPLIGWIEGGDKLVTRQDSLQLNPHIMSTY